MINKTTYDDPNKQSKAQNESTSYSESGFPVLFHPHKKRSQNENSLHTLFKEDTTSSHTDKVPEQPKAHLARSSIEHTRSPGHQPSESIDKFYQEEMGQLKRYIERAEKINKVELTNLQKAKKPFAAYKLTNNPITNPPKQHTQSSKYTEDKRPQPQPTNEAITNINRIRDIYISRNIRKNTRSTLNPKPKRQNEVYRYEEAESYNRNLTRITEDSHEEEILKKNNRRFIGRNSMYTCNTNNVLQTNSNDQSKLRAVRYIKQIDKNEIRSSMQQIKFPVTTTNKQDTPTYYTLNHTMGMVGAPKDHYVDTNDTFRVNNAALAPLLQLPTSSSIVEKKDQATSMKTQKNVDPNEQRIANRINELEKQQYLQALYISRPPQKDTLERSKVESHKASGRITEHREQFVQVPSVHELIIGRDVNSESRQQHQINESFNEDRIEWLIKDYKPRSEHFKNIDVSNFVIKKYKNGVYFGEIKTIEERPIKDGYGSIFYYNGRLYEGQFKNDTKHGRGLELYPDNSKYEGYFQNGHKSGKGRFTWSNGEIYDGQWSRGKKHGSGFWRSAGEQPFESYIGEWFDGKVEGFGVHTTAKRDRYEGEFKNSLKQGVGTERFQSGDVYVGAYFKGRQNGYGEYYYKNGDSYKGQFSNGLRHGKGVFKEYESGNVFEGEFRNDKKCGQGQLVWSNGDVYIGNFENDLRHGYGSMQTTKGKIFAGYWVNGKMFGDMMAMNQTERVVDKSSLEEDLVQQFQTLSLQEKMPRKFKANKVNDKSIPKSKSRSPETLKNTRSKKHLNHHSREKSPNSHYKRACGCSRHH